MARTGAEREAKRKSGQTPEQVDKERADIRVGVARWRSGRTPEQVEKENEEERTVGFSPECTCPKLYPGLTIQSRSAARRAA